ncbi:MAG TPA: methyltransferase MtaB domain-containing protein, partial [Candidatus Binatia bacterium]|nr:methyltransferase MtaB domain-containing protein [Candidatus Binatia bacterium]
MLIVEKLPRIAGSPLETGASSFVSAKKALAEKAVQRTAAVEPHPIASSPEVDWQAKVAVWFVYGVFKHVTSKELKAREKNPPQASPAASSPVVLAYPYADALVFGSARYPVTRQSVSGTVAIGNGAVIPEVNFTLPDGTSINEHSIDTEIRPLFVEMVRKILERSVDLGQQHLLLEFEQLFELTLNPGWGAGVTHDIKKVMIEFLQKYGLNSALRVTIADIREKTRPPQMRTGQELSQMLAAFRECAQAGADILSIESTGGKEVSDTALLNADMEGLAFALGILAPADMAFLWRHIVDICRQYGVIPGGDTACGFANTAMQLAHQKMLPKVLAAVVRLMSAPRSLVAVEQGAAGPLKDCGYENPIIKAITGVPIAMEGSVAACAHSSMLGNIVNAWTDLVSNESVQHVRLLGGFAPAVSAEQLIYTCRLMNAATSRGTARELRDTFVASDLFGDPQALMLAPDVMFEAAKRIIAAGPDSYQRTLAMTRLALETMRAAASANKLSLGQREERWLQRLETAAAQLPQDAQELTRAASKTYEGAFLAAEYGLASSPAGESSRLPDELKERMRRVLNPLNAAERAAYTRLLMALLTAAKFNTLFYHLFDRELNDLYTSAEIEAILQEFIKADEAFEAALGDVNNPDALEVLAQVVAFSQTMGTGTKLYLERIQQEVARRRSPPAAGRQGASSPLILGYYPLSYFSDRAGNVPSLLFEAFLKTPFADKA